MENQMKLIAQLKRIARDNEYMVMDLEEWFNLGRGHFYQASVGQSKLDQKILNQMREKIELFYETGRFKLFDRPKQKINYELLHQIDREYMTEMGSWDPKAYDDPRIKNILYYEDVDK